MSPIVTVIIAAVCLAAGCAGGFALFRYILTGKYKDTMEKAEKAAEVLKEKKLLEVKEKFLNKKSELEKEVQQRTLKIQQGENRLKQREVALNQRQEEVNRRKQDVDQQQQRVDNEKKLLQVKQQDLEKMQEKERIKLEELSGLSSEEAKERLIESLKDQAKLDAASYINEIVDEAKLNANQQAKKIVIQTIQRVATETAIENSVSVFHIDSDEVKGRIIGREGRNIRALETLTGIDLIIDDTPEAVILSGFDPIRREVARIALEKLIVDGRIHPARIEEMVAKARKEVDQTIKEAGEQATFEADVHGLHPEIIKILGRLKYRTSYGQNVLKHSIEVSHLAGLMAAELGCDVTLAKRGGLIHDIGKALDREIEGSHVEIGVDVARKYRESAAVINCIGAHHGDEEFQSVEAVLVAAADAISAARPGARRETLENYLKRLSKLEEIAESFEGVEKCFAIQAGREIRVVVKPDKIDEAESTLLVRNIVKRIESELEYPGQIKVVVIRETRVVDFAK